jgi:peptide/nickel transport system ATP-binding protein
MLNKSGDPMSGDPISGDPMGDDPILEVRDLKVYFHLDEGLLKAVDGVDLTVQRGRVLGIVGESGCGKSVTAQAILQLIPHPGKVEGEILLQPSSGGPLVDIVKLNPYGAQMRAIRGATIGMVFQEPMKAFSPIHTIGNQIIEGILLHVADKHDEAQAIALRTLERVGMPNPVQRLNEYPYQLSGGMRQRALIAMALACQPAILIADEPTTAVDVTVQAQILRLIKDLQADLGMSVIFITHDLGVIAEMAHDVAIMYLGKVVEMASVDSVFYDPRHPYTRALLGCIPEVGIEPRTVLNTIEGTVPVPINLPPGCGFASRCEHVRPECREPGGPAMIEVAAGHQVRCILYR